MRKGKKGKGIISVFLKVLFATMMIGLIFLAAIKLTGPKEKEEEQEAAQPAIVEAEEIEAEQPEENEVQEVEEEQEEEPEQEDDGFDESGCIRDESGRILEKKLETEGDEVTLLFAGDILFDESYAVMSTMRQRGGDIKNCFSPETLEEMKAADIFMLNNEFPYTNRGEPTPEKAFTFRAKPESVKYLQELGADIVSLANNHAYDYGEISLLDSLDTLTEADMPYVGAGRNLTDASQTIYFHAGNQKIAFISATQIERLWPPDTKGATQDSPGVFRCLTEKEIFDRIGEAKENSDFVIVYIHWGTEKTDELDWAQPGAAKDLAAAGADLIIGDHPHVLQEIANVDGVPVMYSLGNYWFNSATLDTCLVKVKVKDGKMQSFQFLPALQSGCSTKLLTGAEKERVINYMRSISGTVTIDDEGYVEF